MIFSMIDGHGRTIDYVRISVTDRCNLRCVYCMPKEGVAPVAHESILSYDEIAALAEAFAALGVRRIKLTGGEPLVRKGIADLTARLKQIPGIEQVTVTTNGVLLGELMEPLASAGIDGINVSLDTLSPEVFRRITRRDTFAQVMEGLQAALLYPQIPLKINCVPMGLRDQNVTQLAELARRHPVHVRYIEMMPIGLGRQFDFRSEDELLCELQRQYGAYQPCGEALGNGPAHYYSFPDFQGRIGFISAISHKFCGTCNRVRLTSQGYLKTCLQYDVGTDLRALLRSGAPQEALCAAIREAIGQKPVGHQFTKVPGEHAEQHVMAQIGG